MFGGLGAETEAESATKSAWCSIWSTGLKRRSKPIVEEPFELIALPQSEPATCPGKTSTPSASSSSRRSERKRSSAPSCAPTARSGRAASPTKSESPVRTSHGSSARERSITAMHVCSGRCPGVWIARSTTAPSDDLGAVGQRIVLVRGVGGGVDRDRQAVLQREPSMSGEMVGVRVRLDRPDDPNLAPRRLCQRRARSRTEDRRSRRRPHPRRRPDTTHSRGRRQRTAGTARDVTLSGFSAGEAEREHRERDRQQRACHDPDPGEA